MNIFNPKQDHPRKQSKLDTDFDGNKLAYFLSYFLYVVLFAILLAAKSGFILCIATFAAYYISFEILRHKVEANVWLSLLGSFLLAIVVMVIIIISVIAATTDRPIF